LKPKNRQGNNQTPQKKSNQVLSDSANNSTKEKIGQTNSNTTASNEESNDNENKHENFKKVIDNETEITIGQKANKISAISAFINALLFISTIVVLAYSIRATNASIKSAEVADSTLKVTKNLFEVQNEPYLQVDNFKIDTFTKKDGIKYKLVIKNLGNYPVKIVDCIFINTIRKSPPSFDSIPQENYPWLLNKYIVKDNEFIEQMIFPLSEGNFWAINTPDFFLYTMGIIKYQNLVTKTIKSYRFQIQSQPSTSNYNLYLINENY
jgi:hypothetical protein